jgi:hypothetical protein
MGARGKKRTYRNPKPKTPERMSFCLRGSRIVQTTGIGSMKIRKSVTCAKSRQLI